MKRINGLFRILMLVCVLALTNTSVNAFAEGEAFFQIDGDAASDLYQVKVNGFKAVSGASGVTLSWDAAEGAVGYIIGSIHNGNGYAQLGWTLETSYLDRDASLTAYSYYWVFPFTKIDNKTVRGLVSENYTYGIRQLPPVSDFKAENAEKAVRLSWNAVEGANGYIIKTRRGSGSVDLLADIQGNMYVDYNAPVEETSFYWVYPYITSGTGKRAGVTSNYVFGRAIAPVSPQPETPQTPSQGADQVNPPEDESYVTQEMVDALRENERYVLNTSTMKVHYKNCKEVLRMKVKNFEPSAKSIDEILKDGYDPCGKCNPR